MTHDLQLPAAAPALLVSWNSFQLSLVFCLSAAKTHNKIHRHLVRDNPGISSGWFLEEPSLHRPNNWELSYHAGAKISVDYEPWAFESFSLHSSYTKIAPSIHDQQVWLQDNILCFKFWNQNKRYIKTVVWILYIYLRFCCWIWCIWVILHCHCLGGDECCSLLNILLCNVDDDIAVMLFSWNIMRTNQDLAHISSRITKLQSSKVVVTSLGLIITQDRFTPEFQNIQDCDLIQWSWWTRIHELAENKVQTYSYAFFSQAGLYNSRARMCEGVLDLF